MHLSTAGVGRSAVRPTAVLSCVLTPQLLPYAAKSISYKDAVSNSSDLPILTHFIWPPFLVFSFAEWPKGVLGGLCPHLYRPKGRAVRHIRHNRRLFLSIFPVTQWSAPARNCVGKMFVPFSYITRYTSKLDYLIYTIT